MVPFVKDSNYTSLLIIKYMYKLNITLYIYTYIVFEIPAEMLIQIFEQIGLSFGYFEKILVSFTYFI
jgi:hypothetical protein